MLNQFTTNARQNAVVFQFCLLRDTAFEMAGTYLNNAIQKKADFTVTPCQLCHVSLDTYQAKSAKKIKADIDLPVVHLPQMVGLVLGIKPEKLGFSMHMVSIEKVLRVL